MAKRTKSIQINGDITVAKLIDILSKEHQDAKMVVANQWNEPVARSIKFTWDEPPLFRVEPDMIISKSWQILNTKTSEIEASGIRLKPIAEYICLDLNKRLDK